MIDYDLAAAEPSELEQALEILKTHSPTLQFISSPYCPTKHAVILVSPQIYQLISDMKNREASK